MRPDDIMKALGGADSAYLDHALEEPVPASRQNRLRPLARLGLIAAVVTLLAGPAYAAVKYMAPSITETEVAPSIFELSLDEKAAEDAPAGIEEYYLPTAPAGYQLELADLTKNDGEVVQAQARWSIPPQGDAGIGTAVPSRMSYPMFEFSVKPLRAVDGSDLSASLGANGVSSSIVSDLSRIRKSILESNGVEYLVYDCPKGTLLGWNMAVTDYFWVDEARHYLLSVEFTEDVPQALREQILASVAKVDAKTWEDFFYPDKIALYNEQITAWNEAHPDEPIPVFHLYLPALRPEAYSHRMQNYIAGQNGMPGEKIDPLYDVRTILHLLDDDSHELWFWNLKNNDSMAREAREKLEAGEADTFVLDGVEIIRYSEEEPGRRKEVWSFSAPDGASDICLEFVDANVEPSPIPEDLKIAFFRSIEEVDPATLTPGQSFENYFFG